MTSLKSDLQRFILVGIGSNIVNFSVYFITYQFGWPLFFSSLTGYVAGLLVSYHFARIWVFGKKFNINKKNIARFIAVYVVGGLGMSFLIEMGGRATNFDYRVIWILGATFAVVNNFTGLKWFVFNRGYKNNGN